MPRNPLSAGLTSWIRRIDRAFVRVANRPVLSLGIAALFSLFVNGTLALFLGVPPPAVHDEYSYWLAADTFTHGRLTNPPHPLWVHFESFHILQQPTYASKYPPGQGMALAVGQILTGQQIVGVWLSSALACSAIGWMLRAWTRPRWALLGSLLVSLHPLMVDWNHNYWGGSVALLGGALVLGAMRRIITPTLALPHQGGGKLATLVKTPAVPVGEGAQRVAFRDDAKIPSPLVGEGEGGGLVAATRSGARIVDGCALGLGMSILANSRPYEGMIACVLSLATILIVVLRNRDTLLRPILSRVLPTTSLILALTIVCMAYYNWRVTGNALHMPYAEYQKQYSASPSFLWASPKPIPEYRHKEIQEFWLQFERPIYEGQQGLAGWLKGAAWKAGVQFHSAFSSIFVLLSLIGLPVALNRSFWVRLTLVFLLLFYVAMIPVVGAIGHYAAPVAGLFFYLIVESLRLIRVWRWSGMRVGQWGVRCLLLGWLLWLIPKAIDMNRFDPEDKCHNQSKERAAILNKLKHEPGKHLVIVRYAPNHSYHAEWVYNEADIDGAKVVWAREMDAEHNRQLLEYFKDRNIWLVEADEVPPRLKEYSIMEARGDPSNRVK